MNRSSSILRSGQRLVRAQETASLRFKRSDYRAHYEDLAVRTLSSIVRHRGLIVSFVALALALACIIIPLMPRKYSAEALIYPNLFSREQGKVVALASVDGAAMVTGEARLIRSDAILRAVAMRLGHDPRGTKSRSWATRSLDWLRAAFLPETRNHSPFDRTVAMLRNKVVVMNDTRSYLISISFTAPVSRRGRAGRQRLRHRVPPRQSQTTQAGNNRSAEAELRQQLAVYGDKHPKDLAGHGGT